jgi:hypothetical protein
MIYALIFTCVCALSVNHAANDIAISAADPEDLRTYKIIRSKLQAFLQVRRSVPVMTLQLIGHDAGVL